MPKLQKPTVSQIDEQIRILCRAPQMAGPLRSPLLRYLVHGHRQGFPEGDEPWTGKRVIFQFYKKRGMVRDEEDADSKEKDSKALVADLCRALKRYYDTLSSDTPDRVIVRIKRGPGRLYEPEFEIRIPQRSAVIPPAPSPPAPAVTSHLSFFRHYFHRYHLTLNDLGTPVWLYTALDFRNSLVTEASLLLHDGDDPDAHKYRWEASALGHHVMVKAERLNRAGDVAIEIFPIQQQDKRLFAGVRVNDTWQRGAVASSIVLLSRTKLVPRDSPGPVALVDALQLEMAWEESNNGTIRRLPSPPAIDLPTQIRTASSESLVSRFWAPHVDSSHGTMIVYGEPLFTRTADRREFTRHVSRNLESGVDRTGGMEACWPFLTYGDARCALLLTRWLTAQHVRMNDWYGCQAPEPDKPGKGVKDLFDHHSEAGTNVIVLGSIRSSSVLADYQAEEFNEKTHDGRKTLPFRIEEERIVKRTDNGALEEAGPWPDELKDPRHKVFAVISRRAGMRSGVVTMIASNYGRAIDRIGEVLTNESLLGEFLRKNPRLRDGWLGNPSTFQVLVKLTFRSYDSLSLSEVVVDAWPPVMDPSI